MSTFPGFREFVTPFGARTNPQYASAAANAYGDLYGGVFQADADRRKADAAGFGQYAQSLGGLGQSSANLYNTFGTNATNLASNQLATMGQAEMARQVGLANTSTAALSGLGQASAGAMGAWGANQAAWAKAMADA